MAFHNLLLLLLAAAVQHIVVAQYDPLKNFCRILDHQSTVVNGTLYIDGGREVFVTHNSSGIEISNHTLGNNRFLVAVDMSKSWDWKTNVSQTEVSKLQDVTGQFQVPDMSRGALFPDPTNPQKFWLFGGSIPQDNQSFVGLQYPQPQANSLWSYDASSNIWKAYDMSSYGIRKPASGATASMPEKGLAFWFNGMQDNGSSSETAVLQDTSKFLDGMVVLDLNNQTAKNISTAAVSNKARVRGQMIHVPLNGSDGVLVLIGGGEKSSGDMSHDWKGTLVSLQHVDVFDVGSLNNASTPDGTWYSQNTSGTIPSPRIDFCIVVASAPDNSSHNIYMYGGRDGVNAYFDEIWVLTLPSFQWIQVFSGLTPRHSLTCHLVGKRQMITVGGSDGQKPTTTCDWENKGVGMIDLSTITWSSTFDAYAQPYTVPNVIVKAIGGTINGSAKIGEPVGGFADPALKEIFYPPLATGSTPLTSPPSSQKKHTPIGAIAGGIIGGLLILAAILGLALFFLRRAKATRRNSHRNLGELDSRPVDPKILDSQPIFEKYGSSVQVPELYSRDVKSELGSRNEAAAPVEMPAGEVHAMRWSWDRKSKGVGTNEERR